jgi:hypothetical protein
MIKVERCYFSCMGYTALKEMAMISLKIQSHIWHEEPWKNHKDLRHWRKFHGWDLNQIYPVYRRISYQWANLSGTKINNILLINCKSLSISYLCPLMEHLPSCTLQDVSTPQSWGGTPVWYRAWWSKHREVQFHPIWPLTLVAAVHEVGTFQKQGSSWHHWCMWLEVWKKFKL